MKRIKDPVFALIIFIIGFVLVSLSYHFSISEEDKNLINYVSFTGTYASLFGIILAYTQILSVKETAEITKLKVEVSNKRVMKVLSVAELAKAIKLVHEIQNYLLSEKIDPAIIRLKDLKSILIQIRYNKDLEALTKSKAYKESISDISINMNNLNQLVLGTKTGVSTGKIISDLDKIENLLGEFEGHLKFRNNDQ